MPLLETLLNQIIDLIATDFPVPQVRTASYYAYIIRQSSHGGHDRISDDQSDRHPNSRMACLMLAVCPIGEHVIRNTEDEVK